MTCALLHLAGPPPNSALRASKGLLGDVLLAGRQMGLSALRGIGLVPSLLAGWMGKVAAAGVAKGLPMRSGTSSGMLRSRKLLALHERLRFSNLLAVRRGLLLSILLALRQRVLLRKLLALRRRLLMHKLLALRRRKVNSCWQMPDSCLMLDTRSWLRR